VFTERAIAASDIQHVSIHRVFKGQMIVNFLLYALEFGAGCHKWLLDGAVPWET